MVIGLKGGRFTRSQMLFHMKIVASKLSDFMRKAGRGRNRPGMYSYLFISATDVNTGNESLNKRFVSDQ